MSDDWSGLGACILGAGDDYPAPTPVKITEEERKSIDYWMDQASKRMAERIDREIVKEIKWQAQKAKVDFAPSVKNNLGMEPNTLVFTRPKEKME